MIWGVSCDSVPQWPGEARFPSPTVLLHFALTRAINLRRGSGTMSVRCRALRRGFRQCSGRHFAEHSGARRCPAVPVCLDSKRIARQGPYVGHRTDSTFPERLWCVHDLTVISARSCRSTVATPYFVEPMSTFVRRELRRSILRPKPSHSLFILIL
jgi:hypothetical protein